MPQDRAPAVLTVGVLRRLLKRRYKRRVVQWLLRFGQRHFNQDGTITVFADEALKQCLREEIGHGKAEAWPELLDVVLTVDSKTDRVLAVRRKRRQASRQV